jgi:hypothetical protein
VRRLPRLAVTGQAVADLTHLIAELIENATVFSPPHTSVQVHGESVANGFVLEIDDRGLGLTPDAMLEANLRLAETPEFELSDTDRLGLFVVSRLAQRQGVRVSLRQSPYGGTTAVVLVPATLLTETGEDADAPYDEADEDAEAPAGLDEPRPTPMSAATEHSFRQWGLTPEPHDEPREHRPHVPEPGERLALPAARSEAPPAAPAPAPSAGPTVLPRRRRAPVLVAENGRPVSEAPRPADPAPEEPATAVLLPRRVRQASLAPQLRTDSTTGTRTAAAGGAGDDGGGRERSPEEVRDRMASLQRGWMRGRADTTDEPDDREGAGGTDDLHPADRTGVPPAERGGDSATRSTTEGNGP